MRSGEQLVVKQIYIQEELEQGNDVSSLSIQRVLSRQQIERETSLLQSSRTRISSSTSDAVGAQRNCVWIWVDTSLKYHDACICAALLKEFGPFHESTIRSYIQQTLCGVQYLHAMGIAHRDLKCANLLLADDRRIKIADFGTDKKKTATATPEDYGVAEVQQQHTLETARSVRDGLGSPYWMAPELVHAEKGDDAWQKADIWGIGCVMIEMATGKPPWEGLVPNLLRLCSAVAGNPFESAHSDVPHRIGRRDPTVSRVFIGPRETISLALPRQEPESAISCNGAAAASFLTTTVHAEEADRQQYAPGDDTSSPPSTSRWGSAASDPPTEQEAFPFPDSSSTYLEAPIPTHATPSAGTLDDDDLGDAKAVPPQGAQEEVGVVPSSSGEAVENAAIVDSREDSLHTAQVNVSSRSERQVESATATTEVAPQEDASDDEASSCASFSSDSGSPHSAASRNSLSSDDDNEPSTAYSSSSDDDNDRSLSATGSFSAEEKKEEEPRFQVLGTVRAIADYASADPNELSMAEGDTLEVLEMRSPGWWRGRLQTKQRDDDTDDTAIAVGWFPCTYIEWIASSANTVVKRTHVAGQENELSVQEGDVVHATASEWRDGCLWAHGSIVSSDDHTRNSSSRAGWFPFESIMDA
ncbi:Ste/ste11 protein kinase, partial [Globisporangium splendens]